MVPGISERSGGTTRHQLADYLGSVKKLTSAGSVTDSMEYDAFGAAVSRTGTTNTQAGFAGGWGYQTDAESEYQLLGHRYYDSATGRFLTRDPIRDGNNYYVYCQNNPLRWLDPSGLKPGEKYSSRDEAARAALIDCQKASDADPDGGDEGVEYIAYIVDVGNGQFSYLKPIKGEKKSSPMFDGFAGYAHTHGRTRQGSKPDRKDPYEDFSPPDKRAAKRNKVPVYLSGPYGVVKKFDPATGKTYIWDPKTERWK